MKTLKNYALSLLGIPYKWAGDDPMGGLDCSGLVQEILSSAGIDPVGDQTADALYRYFKPISTNQHCLGAIAFFGTEAHVTHIAIMIDDWRIVEAGGGGRSTLTLQDAINQNAFVRIRPLTNRKDLVAVCYPGDLYKKVGCIV